MKIAIILMVIGVMLSGCAANQHIRCGDQEVSGREILAVPDTTVVSEQAAKAFYYETSFGKFSYVIAGGWSASEHGETPPPEVGQSIYCSPMNVHSIITPRGKLINGFPCNLEPEGGLRLMINNVIQNREGLFWVATGRGASYQVFRYSPETDELVLIKEDLSEYLNSDW